MTPGNAVRAAAIAAVTATAIALSTTVGARAAGGPPRPPGPPGAAGGLQHIAAMVAGVVAPPLIIGAAVGLNHTDQAMLITASLFTAGLATVLQSLGWWRFGSRLPLMNGASFAAVAPVLAIAKTSAPGSALPAVY
ncbi:solute carrier family 23 protein [Nocardia wallacei]|uniref:solute carrier family 23 protein n=1 Tax=Nocardia wallacei TaxID=480035 RepID=UPI00313B4D71